MSTVIKIPPIILVLWVFALATLEAAESEGLIIEVFTTSEMPLTGVQTLERQGMRVKVFLVDDLEKLDRELSTALPGKRAQAIEAAQRRIRARHAALRKRYQEAAEALQQALIYGLDRIPAVVFDRGDAVVFGETDLEAAYASYRRWQVSR